MRGAVLFYLALQVPAIAAPRMAKATLIQNAEGNFLDFGAGYAAQLFVGRLPARIC